MRVRSALCVCLVALGAGAATTNAAAPSLPGRIVFTLSRPSVDLVAADAKGLDIRHVVTSLPYVGASPRLSPDGHKLAYVSEGGLHVRDLVTGEDRTIDPTSGLTDFSPAWSPDGAQLVWLRSTSTRKELRVADADGSDQHAVGTSVYGSVDWSPDGSRLAVVRRDTLGATDVVVVTLAGGAERVYPLGFSERDISRPRWSPDGTLIALDEPSSSFKLPSTIAVLSTATGRLVAVPSDRPYNHVDKSSPDWLADGRLVYWADGDLWAVPLLPAEGVERLTKWGGVGRDWTGVAGQTIVYPQQLGLREQMYSVAAAGGPSQRLSDVVASSPVYSPDGTKIAFIGSACACGGPLLVMPAGGGGATQIGSTTTKPAWSPDGQELVVGTRTGLAIISVAGSRPRALRGTRAGDREPAWSPGGRFILFTRIGKNKRPELWRVVPSGGHLRLMRRGAEQGAWSPDGRMIAFAEDYRWPGPHRHIWRMQSDGTRAFQVTFAVPVEWTGNTQDERHPFAPAWSPDGKWIAYNEDMTEIATLVGPDTAPCCMSIVSANGGTPTPIPASGGGRTLSWGPIPLHQ